MKPKLISAALVAALAVGGAGAAFASMKREAAEPVKTREVSDAAAMAQAKISLTEAIAIAERRTGERAFEAALEAEDGQVAYEVAVLSGSAGQEVLVDARSGAVLKVVAEVCDEEVVGSEESEGFGRGDSD